MNENTITTDPEPMKRTRKPFTLTEQQKTELEKGFEDGFWSPAQQNRASALMKHATGMSVLDTALDSCVAQVTVQSWVRKYRNGGVAALMGWISPIAAS